MNTREKMYQQITRHGEQLNAIFNTGIEPVKLYKALHRLELQAHRLATDYCNGENGVTSENWEQLSNDVLAKVYKVLGTHKYRIFLNGDARGYALKVSDEIVRAFDLKIYTDWGGYGILAPEFNGK